MTSKFLSSPYFRASFERQEWVHDWIRPTVQYFGLVVPDLGASTPIAIMLEMQGGLDGYLVTEGCSVSYKTRAPLAIEENIPFWRNFADSVLWITPNLKMRVRLGAKLGLSRALNGVDLGHLQPANLHEFSLQLAKATAF